MTSHFGEIATLSLYYGILGLLAVYGAHRLLIVSLYYRHRGAAPRPAGALDPLPRVTVQLPIFNEVYVVERLIARRRPRSTIRRTGSRSRSSTTRPTRRARSPARPPGGSRRAASTSPICPARDRDGFKAGALAGGPRGARGEFLAIFDADFVPAPDFLRRAVPHFADPGVGLVQARWDHLNRDYSLLTRIQAILLDGHFVIEHTARHRSGRFFNFNGTAGVWRRALPSRTRAAGSTTR